MTKSKTVVYTAGTWDLFHIGHLNLLKKSKELGDFLIVAVSTDKLVESYKLEKPFIKCKDRVEIVKAIKYVDKVITQDILLNVNQLKKYKPDIVTIGDDWKNKYLEGLEWMKKNGKVVYIPYTKDVCTTILKKKLREKLKIY